MFQLIFILLISFWSIIQYMALLSILNPKDRAIKFKIALVYLGYLALLCLLCPLHRMFIYTTIWWATILIAIANKLRVLLFRSNK